VARAVEVVREARAGGTADFSVEEAEDVVQEGAQGAGAVQGAGEAVAGYSFEGLAEAVDVGNVAGEGFRFGLAEGEVGMAGEAESASELAGEGVSLVETGVADVIDHGGDVPAESEGQVEGNPAGVTADECVPVDAEVSIKVAGEGERALESEARGPDAEAVAQGNTVCGADGEEEVLGARGAVGRGRDGRAGVRPSGEDVRKAPFEVEDCVEAVHGSAVSGGKEDLAQSGLRIEQFVQGGSKSVMLLDEPVVHGVVPGADGH
jgi:hypothetical protein